MNGADSLEHFLACPVVRNVWLSRCGHASENADVSDVLLLRGELAFRQGTILAHAIVLEWVHCICLSQKCTDRCAISGSENLQGCSTTSCIQRLVW